MQADNALTPAQKREQTQIIFIAAMAGLSMVVSAVYVLIAYLIQSGAAFALFLSLKQWTERANLDEPPTALALDHPSKNLAGIFIGLVGVFLLQLNPISQIILCTTFGGALAAFFIHDCILNAQNAVDKALREACQKGELDKVKKLLALKASPFAPDTAGNNAFHLAMQSHQASMILEELQKTALQEALTIKDVLKSAKHLFNEDISQKWSTWVTQVKNCILAFTQENRASLYEASLNVISAYYAPLQLIVNTGAEYLIEQLSYPSDIEATNKAGQKPADILKENTTNWDKETLAKLQKTLEELAQHQSQATEQEDDSPVLRFSPPQNANRAGAPSQTALGKRIKPKA